MSDQSPTRITSKSTVVLTGHFTVLFRADGLKSILYCAPTQTPIAGEPKSSPRMIRETIQARMLVLWTEVDAHMRKSQTQYKLCCEQFICKTPRIPRNGYFFFDKPPLRASSNLTVNTIEKKGITYSKSRISGPYRIISVQDHTITIDENVIPKKVATSLPRILCWYAEDFPKPEKSLLL